MTQSILLANLYHETHTFLKDMTTLDDFIYSEHLLKDEILKRHHGDHGPIDAFLQHADKRNWEVIPSVTMVATPSGMVQQEVVEVFWSHLEADLIKHVHSLDGVYLVLHGAMVSESMDDVEGEMLRRIHALFLEQGVESIPVVGLLDLHCNFSAMMARYSDCLLAYRENPHTDIYASSVRAVHLLDRLLNEALKPKTYYQHPPLMFSPQGTATNVAPLKCVLARAREIEANDDHILCINIFAGYSFADTADTGFSVSCVTLGSEEQAQVYLQELCAIAFAHREAGHPQGESLTSVLDAISQIKKREAEAVILLVETSDNIGGGAPGDGTHALGALLRNNIDNIDNIVAIIADPQAVQACQQAGLHEQLELFIGGKTDAFHGEPLAVSATVMNITSGDFILEDPSSPLAAGGERVKMGDCALIEIKGKHTHEHAATILLTSRKMMPVDLGILRSQGIEPESAGVILMKAAVAHKQAFDPIAQQSFHVDTPGLCSSYLPSLHYTKIQRPIFPLDPVEGAML